MNLLGKSLVELKELLKKKELDSKELHAFFLERNKKYKEINAYVTLIEDEPKIESLPISIKDNFCINGVRTTASSKVLDRFVPPYSATVVQKLLSSNISFIGKNNLDAWAHGSSTETSDYGPTKNPWDVTKSPGGSSGGSAAAVSAYLAPAAIGSETAGSIRQPASWTGVVGLKPTYGRVSRYGVVAMGSSFDCPGPITLTVEDSAYLLRLIAGKDRYDATSADMPVPDYQSEIKEKKKFSIGITDEYFEGVDEEVKQKTMEALKVFEKMGHTVKKIKLISPKYAISVYTILQRAEVSSNLARYTGIRYGHDRSYFGDEAKKRIMLGTYTLSHGFFDAYYKTAEKVRTLIIEDFKKVFKEVDVIISPTTPITALKLGEFEKYPFFGEVMDVLNEPAAVAGIPGISIPIGLDRSNMPVGLQIMGNYFDESSVLNLAYQFEKETNFYDVIKKGVERYG
jgi:aspartyl-tRNA(Asn)/glutamyl-tRNA(Gln) amidotransferase subunit A